MTLVVDARPLVALADRGDPLREPVRGALLAEIGPLVLPAFAAAEADYLIATRLGPEAERFFLQDLASDVYSIEALTSDEHRLVVELNEKQPGLGLTDLSIVILAGRYRTNRLLTFDERDFRALRPRHGEAFVILPADAS